MISRVTIARIIWWLFGACLVITLPWVLFGIFALPLLYCYPFVLAVLLFALVYWRRDAALARRVLLAGAIELLAMLGVMSDGSMFLMFHGAAWKSIITLPPLVVLPLWLIGTLLPPTTTVLLLRRLRRIRNLERSMLAQAPALDPSS